MRRLRRTWTIFSFLVLLVASSGNFAARAQTSPPANASTGAALTISGDVEKPLVLSLDDLRHMPRKTFSLKNPHDGNQETYEGVPLAELLKRAGVPRGGQMRAAASAYIVAEAKDGFRAVLSVAEADPDFADSEILVADTFNGAALGENDGPLRLVLPHEHKASRSVRMLHSLTVVSVSK
ncbi:MAG TPA: molybdopterin-dependent oxidoreductase [Candidatus Acidoferrales bacterium]|nr:molybdopterin-dependent oxidoreductase [Candidatus Acidoferrales bacterium]